MENQDLCKTLSFSSVLSRHGIIILIIDGRGGSHLLSKLFSVVNFAPGSLLYMWKYPMGLLSQGINSSSHGALHNLWAINASSGQAHLHF